MPASRILDAGNVMRGGKGNAELSDITAALVRSKQVTGGQADPERAEELRVASNRLTALTTVPSCFLHTVVQHITVLDASHNQLRDFRGLEMFTTLETLNLSHNQIQVVDVATASVLLSLRHLQTVILSYNQLKYVDWDVSAGHGAMRRSRAGSMSGDFSGAGYALDEEEAAHLTFTIASLDLSHNELIELPDLRTLPLLEELYVEDNAIEDLTDLEQKVPLLRLQTLTLAHNGLTTCAALVPLAAVGETLLHLTLGDNPFATASASTVPSTTPTNSKTTTTTTTHNNQRRGHQPGAGGTASAAQSVEPGWWRPYVLFLVPLLITLDETDLSEEERRIAGAVLFRQRAHAPLSRSQLELMNPQRNNELEAYLQKASCWVGASSFSPAETVTASSSRDSPPLKPTRSAARTTPLPTPTSTSATTTTTADASPNGSLDATHSGAAPLAVVVKAMQGKLKSLSHAVQILWQAHVTAPAPQPSRLSAGAKGDPEAETVPPDSARSVASSTVAAADMQDIVTTMRNLQQVMTSMWGDLDEFRGLVARVQFKAALTIQRYYRGHRARCEWRVLREDYHAFLSTLTPDVLLLQRAGRGYLARQRLGPRYEVHALRQNVAHLQKDVAELRQLVLQHCQTTPPVPAAAAAAAPSRGRHVDPIVNRAAAPAGGAAADAGSDNSPSASAPLKPQRIMVRRRSSSGGSDRGSSLPQARAVSKAAAEPASDPRHSETPDRLGADEFDEL